MKSTIQRNQNRLLALAGAGLLSTLVGGALLARGADVGDFGEGVGGLPGHSGGSSAAEVEDRPMLRLTGGILDLDHALLGVHGDGEMHVASKGAQYVYTFVGDFELLFDEAVLLSTDVELSVLAAGVGGPMKGVFEAGRMRTPVFTVAAGAELELPFDRMVASGVLDRGASLHTYNQASFRSYWHFESGGGLLSVQQIQ